MGCPTTPSPFRGGLALEMITVLVLIILLDVKNRHDLVGVHVTRANSPQRLQSCLNTTGFVISMGPCTTALTQGPLRALQAHVVLCMLSKIHRDGEHWASAEAGQVQDHVSSKTTGTETPSEGLIAFKISPVPSKNMLNIHKRSV